MCPSASARAHARSRARIIHFATIDCYLRAVLLQFALFIYLCINSPISSDIRDSNTWSHISRCLQQIVIYIEKQECGLCTKFSCSSKPMVGLFVCRHLSTHTHSLICVYTHSCSALKVNTCVKHTD